jgi:hypothetical protein
MSIAPTQNQNTAPVFEFDCLFTHDLRKKKKTWHDGRLRFHTFNRRIMVYDDSKNFIGDLHYRDAGDLQEGEELRLDKGVLVDVGRRTGQTETDLADVLDKGRHGDEGAQSKQAIPAAIHQIMQRMPSLNAQGRPKSLAAVLGASQGPIGRARLAIKSPYEQLHSTRPESVIEQPPAKRQRINTDKENPSRISKVVRAEQQDRSPPIPSFSPSLPRAPLTVRRQVNSSRTVINISSEDEDPVSPPFSSAFGSGRGRQKGTKAMRNPPAKLDLEPKPAKPKQKPLPRLLSVIEAPAVSLNTQDKQIVAEQHVLISPREEPLAKPQAKRKASEKPVSVKHPTKVLSKTPKEQIPSTKLTVVAEKPLSKEAPGKQKEAILPASSARSVRLSLGPVTSLRFAPQKSRPKLMYEALLPSAFVASRPGSSRSASATSAAADTSIDLVSGPRNITPRISKKSNYQHEKDLFDLSSLESIPGQTQRAPTPAKSPPRQKGISPRQVSSPLFCTQSPSNVMPDVMVIEDDSPVPSPIKTPLPKPRIDAARSIDDELPNDAPIPVHEPEPAHQLPPASKLTLMDQRLMMPPPRIEPPSPSMEKPVTPGQQPSLQISGLAEHLPFETPQPRPFRRVLSGSDSPAQVNNMLTISPPAARVPSVLAGMQHRSNAKSAEPRKPFKSPAELQRSYSDTAAMLQIEVQRPIGQLSINVPEIVDEVDEDVGPWSTREAFLLFDYWPPGREKPDYGDEARVGPHPQAQSFGGFTHPRNAECFGQQLSVIRDGVDI